jgi:serine kinase of HPr protein (carbohydrate metabolism regulator)
MVRVHGSSVALDGRGILLRGPSGSGKSDLALRLIDQGAMLVADDQTELRRAGDGIEMTPPATIAGRMEVRGLGIVDVPHLPRAPLDLVVELAPPASVERMPEPRTCAVEGVEIPFLVLDPFAASAPAKLKLALKAAVSRGAPAAP